MNFFVLYLLLLKAMLTSFSGLASVPIIRQDLVVTRHVMTDRQLNTALVAGQTGPGPVGLYVVSVGYFVSGVPGAIAGLLAASTEVFGAMSESTDVAIFFAIFSMTGLGLATANYWAITQTLLPGIAPGRVGGIQNTALNLAGIVAPIITGFLKQITGSYTAPMQTIWVVLIIGVAAYLFLARESDVYVSRDAMASAARMQSSRETS